MKCENFEKFSRAIEEAIQSLKNEIREAGQLQYIFTAEELLSSTEPNRPNLLDPLFPQVGIGALIGGSDTGKSAWLRNFAIAVVTGERDFLGFPINAVHNKVIYVSSEDDQYALRRFIQIQNNGKNYPAEYYRGG